MVDRAAPLSIRRQCELLQISRSGVYYEPEPTGDDELALMRRIDELHLKFPFYGSRRGRMRCFPLDDSVQGTEPKPRAPWDSS